MSDEPVDDGRGVRTDRPHFLPINQQQLEEALSFRGVPQQCDKCNANNWFYVTRRDDDNNLAWTYLLTGDEGDRYETLSYYTRSCLTCGNMQNYSRVIIQAIRRRISNGES